jgi:hypothetical protein
VILPGYEYNSIILKVTGIQKKIRHDHPCIRLPVICKRYLHNSYSTGIKKRAAESSPGALVILYLQLLMA